MRSALGAACVAMAVSAVVPAQAAEVLCGEEWVAFTPFMPNGVDMGNMQITLPKARITQGRFFARVGQGYIRVEKGMAGSDYIHDEFKLPGKAYLAVRACLIDGPEAS